MREEMLAVGGRRRDELPGLPRAYCSTVSRSTMMSQLLDHDPVDEAVQRGAPRSSSARSPSPSRWPRWASAL